MLKNDAISLFFFYFEICLTLSKSITSKAAIFQDYITDISLKFTALSGSTESKWTITLSCIRNVSSRLKLKL